MCFGGMKYGGGWSEGNGGVGYFDDSVMWDSG